MAPKRIIYKATPLFLAPDIDLRYIRLSYTNNIWGKWYLFQSYGPRSAADWCWESTPCAHTRSTGKGLMMPLSIYIFNACQTTLFIRSTIQYGARGGRNYVGGTIK